VVVARRFGLALLVLGVACRTGAPASAPAVPSPPPPERTTSTAIRWVRDSAEHRALFIQVYRSATEHVEREAAGRERGTWAVALDADETVIDNSLYQVEREQAGEPFTPGSWHDWTTRREAVPLPGAAAFLARVRELGGRVFIVTNRRVSECPDTEAVFRAYGLVYDAMLCRPDAGPGDKNPRLGSIEEGTTGTGLPPLALVAIIGDNIQDFPGMSQAIRDGADEAFAPFGARFFVLPNPMYGSWE